MATERVLGTAGGRDNLARVLSNPLYVPLLEHRTSRRGPLRRIEASARLEVTVADAAGVESSYLFSLARRPRQDGFTWRITGLVRAERADA